MKKQALFLLLVISATWRCWFVLAQRGEGHCPSGEFYNPGNEGCVTECPCGTYGDSYSAECKNDGDGLFFNQTHITADLLAEDTAKTAIASIKLVVDRNLSRNGSLYFKLYYYIYIPEEYSSWFLIQFYDRFMANFRVDVNEQTAEAFGEPLSSTFNFSNTTECSNGTHTFLTVPINTYIMNVTGVPPLALSAKLGNELTGYKYSRLIIDATIDNGCSGDHLSYDFSTGECVETCPCGTSSWFGSCQKIPSVSFAVTPKTVHVTSESTAGSKIATLRILMNTETVNHDYGLSLHQNYRGALVQHNSSGRSLTRYHNVGPAFKFLPSSNSSNPTASSPGYIYFNPSATAELLKLSPVYCTVNSQSYIAISLDLYLLTNSLYHLGDHSVLIASFYSHYWFSTDLMLRVEAECEDMSQFYDFSVHECVSQCPCGYAPFHQHNTAYCEAVTYNLAEFLNDSSTVQIPWNNPPATVTTTIALYINYNSYYFSWTTNGIVARVEIIYNGIQTYNGTSLPAKNTIVPSVTLTDPDGAERSPLELLLKSTTDGIEYCYDELQNINHTIYRIRANIHSPYMYSQTGAHDFTIKISFYYPDSLELTRFIQHRTDKYALTVNVTTSGVEEESSPPLQDIPSIGKQNTHNFTITSQDDTFTQSRQQLFRQTTARVITEYCSTHLCIIIPHSGGQPIELHGLTVAEQDVALPVNLIKKNEQGRLIVGFYVQLTEGFVSLATIQLSVVAGEEQYIAAGFLYQPQYSSSVKLMIVSTSLSMAVTTLPMMSSIPPPVIKQELGLIVPLGAVAGGLVLILASLIVIAVCIVLNMRKSKTTVGRYMHYRTQENTYSPTSAVDDDKSRDTVTPKEADVHAIEMTGYKNPMIDEQFKDI